MAKLITRLDVAKHMKSTGFAKTNLQEDFIDFVLEMRNIKKELVNECQLENAKRVVRSIMYKIKDKYNKVCRHFDVMINENVDWFNKEIPLHDLIHQESHSGPGRPSCSWEDLSQRSKRRHASRLSNEKEEMLALAAVQSARGKRDKQEFAYVIKEAISSPTRAKKMKCTLDKKSPVKFSNEKALAVIVDCDLSYKSYHKLRTSAVEQNADIFPTNNDIAVAKRDCYPDEINVTETQAECDVQSLLQHTSSRLIKLSEEKIKNISSGQQHLSGVLYCKWGFDGASGQSIYKQQYHVDDIDEAIKNEQSVFCTCVVPLRLEIEKESVWINEVPSSTHYCRPVRIQYVKETPDILKAEECYVKQQLHQFTETFHYIKNSPDSIISISVSYNMALTMLDGKAINALTNTRSTQNCNICGAKPSEMNKFEIIKEKQINDGACCYGISSLHSWIRFFEYVIHIGYRIEIKKFQARTEAEKCSLSMRKRHIQKLFRSRLSLNVDQPRVGSGNSNDGNTARRAFKNTEEFSDITGVDLAILTRLYTILQVITCNFSINPDRFQDYCSSTASLLIELYPWYIIPPSVHKILFHGRDIIDKFPFPIGIYSEEAQEAQNKFVRNARLSHARKLSRKDTIEDQLHFLLISSDPVISNLRKVERKDREILTSDARTLLDSYDEMT